MNTKIGLEGVEFFAFHGYYPEERKAGNHFIVDLSVDIKGFDSLKDDINDTVNYETLFNICKEEFSKTQKLLETLALNILKRIQSEHKLVQTAQLKIRKRNPQMGGKIDYSFVEMSF